VAEDKKFFEKRLDEINDELKMEKKANYNRDSFDNKLNKDNKEMKKNFEGMMKHLEILT
jgi:hypothetical protein